MSKLTKTAIMHSFIKLLNKYPFEKITVKDIADDCGINRNTFYYNFEDIYALVDEILQNEIHTIAKNHKQPYSSWKEGLLSAAEFALKNKKAVYNLYNSIKRPQLEKYFERVIYYVVLEFTKEKAKDIDIDESELNFIAFFYCSALLGVMNKWLDSNMKEDFEDIVDKTGFLFDNNITQAIKLISENNL